MRRRMWECRNQHWLNMFGMQPLETRKDQMNYAPDITLSENLPAQADVRSQISSSLLDKLNHQLNHEFFASHSYLSLAAWCDARHLQVMLQWFVQEQVEEEKWAEELVAKAQMAGCSGAMFMLDHRYAKQAQPASETGQRSQASLSAS